MRRTGLLLVLAAAAALPARADQPPRKPVVPAEVAQQLRESLAVRPDAMVEGLRQHLDRAVEIVDAERPGALAQAQADRIESGGFAARRKELAQLRAEFRSAFAKLRGEAATVSGAGQLAEFDSANSRIEARFDELDAAYAAVEQAPRGNAKLEALNALRSKLQAAYLSARNRDVAPSTLPLPTLSPLAPAGAPGPENRSERLPEYLSQAPPRHLQLAFEGDLVQLAAAPPPVAPGTQNCATAPADTAEDGREIEFSDDIKTLAEQLGYSPTRIYQWVYEEIRYQPYWGSLKGAAGTLLTRAGNATDQASLLIALLRHSGVPARYVRGTVAAVDQTPQDSAEGRAQRWLGVKNYNAAAQVLAGAGVPAGPYTIDAIVQGIAFDHVWVEACVPYATYRGLPVEDGGYRWVPLDTAFKDRSYQPGLSVSVSIDAMLAAYRSSSRSDELPDERYRGAVEAAAVLIDPNATAADVPYRSRLVKTRIDVLPATLPFEVIDFDNWPGTSTPDVAALPDAHRYKFTATIRTGTTGTGTTLLSATASYPEASLGKISLSYPPNAASQALWNSWGGDLTALPVGAVNLFPVLKLDGVQQGSASTTLPLGQAHSVIMKLTLGERSSGQCIGDAGGGVDPDGTCVNKTLYTDIKAGGYYALGAYAFQAVDALLSARAALLSQAVRSTPTPPTPAQSAAYEATVGELLHVVLLDYLGLTDAADERNAALSGFVSVGGFDIGLTGSDLKVEYIFDQPYAIKLGGVYIDFKGGVYQFVKLDSTATTTAQRLAEQYALAKLGIYSGSAFEHYVWQQAVRTDAVSTVRGMQFASETSVPLVTLNAGNIASYNSLMDASMQPYKAQIQAYVAAGGNAGIVVAPKKTIAYDGTQTKSWRGAVYMTENPVTGAFGAIISGALSGAFPLIFPQVYTEVFSPSPILPTVVTSQPSFVSQLTGLAPGTLGSNSTTTSAFDPVNMLTGNMYHRERDFAIKGRGGLPIVFERWYNAQHAKDGPLGFGWTHSFHHSLKFYGVESGQAKVGWVDGTGGEKFFATSGHSAGNITPGGPPLTNQPGILVRVSRLADGRYQVREKDGLTYTFESLTAPNSPPAAGSEPRARLLEIRDRNNNVLTLAYNATCGNRLCSVTDGLNRAITFTYVGSRIDEVRDWTGRRWNFDYDASGNLVRASNPLALADQQNPAEYTYYSAPGLPTDHAMQRYTLPRGNGMEFEYYPSGRVLRHTNTLGEQVTFSYNEFRREGRTVNERGYERVFMFDEYGNPVRILDEGGGEHRYEYDSANPYNRTRREDPNGLAWQYTYDANGNVTDATPPRGTSAATQSRDFNTFNQPQRIRDGRGNWTLLAYDAKGNLTDQIRLKSGHTPTAGATPPVNQVLLWTKHEYDAFGNLLKVKRLRDFAGATLGNFATGTGPSFEYTHDASGLNVVQWTRRGDQDGTPATLETDVSATFTYDALGRLKSGLDARWYAVAYEYDDLGRVLAGTDGFGQQRGFAYDDNGNPVGEELVVDAQRHDSSSASYDLSDRRARALDAGGNLTRFDYDAAGNLIRVTDADNYATAIDYDSVNRPIAAYDQEGNRVDTQRDAAGRVRSLTDPNGNRVTTSYWGASRDGLVKRITQPPAAGFSVGQALERDYDTNGNVIKTLRLPAGAGFADSPTQLAAGAGIRDSVVFYDEANRPVRGVGPALANGQRLHVCTKYSNLGFVSEVWAGPSTDTTSATCNFTNPNLKRQVSFGYDDFGRKLSETDPLGRIARWTYDVHGNVLTAQDAKTQTTTYAWFYGGLLASWSNASGSVSYTRNPRGQVETAETRDAASQLLVRYSYDYDNANRLQRVTDSRAGKALTYRWSPGGRLSELTDSDGNASNYNYDAVGRLASIFAPNSEPITFGYDPGGRLTRRFFPSGAATRYAYHPDSSLDSVANYNGAGLVSEHAYTYDAYGNRATQVESIGGLTTNYTYGYDAFDRLTSVADGATTETYGYDVFGNRSSRQVGAGALIVSALNDAHELLELSQGGTRLAAFVYDANGSLTRKCAGGSVTVAFTGSAGTRVNTDCSASGAGASTLTATFDALDRVTELTAGAVTERYTYDDSGRRIRTTHAGTPTDFLYAGPDIHAEYAATWGAPQALTVHGPGSDDALLRLSGVGLATARYFHADGLGSVVAVSGAANTRTNLAREAGTTVAPTGVTASYTLAGIASSVASVNNAERAGTSAGGFWLVNAGAALELTFAGAREVEEVVLTFVQDNASDPAEPVEDMSATATWNTQGAQVQSWNGSAWVNVAGASFSGNSAVIRRLSFAPVTTSRLRIQFPDPDGIVSVTEVEVYALPAGGATATQRFDAWGNRIGASGSVAVYGYTGREPTDPAIGLSYHRARFYDPSVGRFISKDPLGLANGELSPYLYAASNPILFTDPYGLLPQIAAGPGSYWGSFTDTLSDVGSSLYNALPTRAQVNTALDRTQTALDIAGLAAQGPLEVVAPFIDLAGAGVAALRGDWTGAGLSTLGAVPVLGSVANVAKVGRHLDTPAGGLADLGRFRSELGLPAAGTEGAGTLSRLDVGGQSFYGINAHGQKVDLTVNPISRTHAETDAFQQARNAGTSGGSATLYVDRDLCRSCGQNGAVESMAKQLSIDNLTIVTPSGTVVIRP
jgi:RHS repeat-associated protein